MNASLAGRSSATEVAGRSTSCSISSAAVGTAAPSLASDSKPKVEWTYSSTFTRHSAGKVSESGHGGSGGGSGPATGGGSSGSGCSSSTAAMRGHASGSTGKAAASAEQGNSSARALAAGAANWADRDASDGFRFELGCPTQAMNAAAHGVSTQLRPLNKTSCLMHKTTLRSNKGVEWSLA
jgi:hypothetical protein